MDYTKIDYISKNYNEAKNLTESSNKKIRNYSASTYIKKLEKIFN